jgi:hypothetical protein
MASGTSGSCLDDRGPVSNPDDFRVRGDTFRMDISLAWVGPALSGVGVILSVMAAWRMFSMPQVAVEWSSRNFWWLVVLTAALLSSSCCSVSGLRKSVRSSRGSP